MLLMRSRPSFKSVDLNLGSYYYALHNKKLIVTLSSLAGVLGSMQQGGVFHILSFATGRRSPSSNQLSRARYDDILSP
ncbi:MAG: hypothetical protein ACXWCY_10095 [Burkholderiales bacterium]